MPEQIFNKTVLRSYRGPASELMTLKDEQGYRYIGIRFYEQYSHHPMLVDSLDGIIDLLKGMRPRGLVPLMDFAAEEGAFLYGTGDCVSIAESFPVLNGNIKPGFARVELLRGAETFAWPLISHRRRIYPWWADLWRMLLSKDGQVKIICQDPQIGTRLETIQV